MRAILERGPGFAQEVSALLNQIKPTLPVLLANLTTVGQILVTYNPSLEQLLVSSPRCRPAGIRASAEQSHRLPMGDFSLTISDPPPCTVGFLPPSQWRSPADTTDIDTPEDLYCKLPQDSPIAVRGARNYPCMGHPASVPRRSNCATTPRASSRRRCVSTRPARTPSTRTSSRRDSRSMIGSTSRSEFTHRRRHTPPAGRGAVWKPTGARPALPIR